MGVIGMKIYVRGLVSRLPFHSSMELFFRYALSQDISLAVIGCDNLRQLEENTSYAAAFTPLDLEAQQDLIEAVEPFAHRLLYYRP